MALEFAPTSELEAVNLLLDNIGRQPINTLEGPLPPDAVSARKLLKRISKQVQGEGWQFNTEPCYPLALDANGNIPLPNNILRVDAVLHRHPDIDPVQRGLRLYDRKNRTYVFTQTIEAKLVLLLAWEELPETARLYIAIRSARQFQEDQIGSSTLAKFDAQDEVRALADLKRAEGDTANLNILDNYGTFRPGSVLRR